jgi:hypothetical protein
LLAVTSRGRNSGMGSTGITISLHPLHSARRQRVGVGSTAQRAWAVRPGQPRHRGDRVGTPVDTGMTFLDNDTTSGGEV